MKVAVLTLTRGRLNYTRACLASLRQYAGIDYDHFVLDQASDDGTFEWLERDFATSNIVFLYRAVENLGIHRAMNILLDAATGPDSDIPYAYDVVVKVDNDCEFTTPGTLRAVADVHRAAPRSMVGPLVNGLRGPVPLGAGRFVAAETEGEDPLADEHVVTVYNVALTPMIGGIVQPIPHGWRYNESSPPWGGDDDALSAQADWCGQLLDYPVNHYRGTDQQHLDYPSYFQERVAAGGPA